MQLSQALPRGRQAVSRLVLPSLPYRRLSRPFGSVAAASWPSPPATPRRLLTPATRAAAVPGPSTASARAGGRRCASSLTAEEPLQKTALYDLHVAHGAKMVPFGGFHMPVQYKAQSVLQSHHFTRSHAALFDVGHMVQHTFAGPGAAAFLQRVTPASLSALPPHHSTLSTLLWPGTGGIVDDTVVTKLRDDLFYVVTNAGCRAKDLEYLGDQLRRWRDDGGVDVEHEVMDGWGLVALQGPLAAEILPLVLAEPAGDLRDLYFGQCRFLSFKPGPDAPAQPLLVSRGGYTGEDGFEISIPPAHTVGFTEALLTVAGPERLQLAGLGARDSLRLEAGMCLYGHDLDDTTTPVEAGLSWVIGKDRRAAGAFHGADVILPQLTPKSKGGRGVERRRVGLVVEGGIAREGAEIVRPASASADGGGPDKIGVVTSGCPSPTLGQNIAMGYVRDGLHKAGTELEVLIRGRPRKATVTKMPFVPSKYHKAPAPAPA